MFPKLVVMLHAVAAIALVGAATHHVCIARGYLRGAFKVRLGRIYAATVAVAWLLTFALGLLAYPAFRYDVRALYMDHAAPWATSLFEIKEYLGALGVPLVIGVFMMSRVMQAKDDRTLARTYAAMVALVAAFVWFDLLSGLLVTMVKGV